MLYSNAMINTGTYIKYISLKEFCFYFRYGDKLFALHLAEFEVVHTDYSSQSLHERSPSTHSQPFLSIA